MKPSQIRRAAASTLVVPVVLLAAACGSTAPAPAPAAPAAGGTQSSTSSAPTPGASTPTSPAPTSDAPVANGETVDNAEFVARLKAGTEDASTVHITMNMSGAGQSTKMEGDTKLDGDNPAMKLKMDAGGMDLEMLVVDKKVYMKGMPGQSASKWAVYDENSSIGKQMAASANQADPARMYDKFEQGLKKVTKVGEEKVDGEDMEKYVLTLDTKKAMDMPATGGVKIPDTIDYTIWLDGDDHMRQVTFDLMGVKALMTMSKYGEPVDISAPAAGDTVKGTM